MKNAAFLKIGCIVVLFALWCPNAFGSVGGQGVCGTGTDTLYRNLSGAAIKFDLSVSVGQGGSSMTLTWTDANGHAQTITVGSDLSEGVSTSLAAGGAVTYTCSGTASFTWQLERAPV